MQVCILQLVVADLLRGNACSGFWLLRRPSVFHTGWNSPRIISRPISLIGPARADPQHGRSAPGLEQIVHVGGQP